MIFYGVVSSQTEKVIEFFLSREEAGTMIADVRKDEPDLAKAVRRAMRRG